MKIGKFSGVITYYEWTTVCQMMAENTLVTEMLGVWRTRGELQEESCLVETLSPGLFEYYDCYDLMYFAI